MFHSTTFKKQAETSLHFLSLFLLSDILSMRDEAYTRIANTRFRISLLQKITFFSPLWAPYLPQLYNFPYSVGALTLPDVAILPQRFWCKTGLKFEMKNATGISTLSCCSQFPQDNESSFFLPLFPFVSNPLNLIVK